MKYLHSANIIHRDLKPGNLLVNSNCLLRICDFGFARAIEPNHKTAMTQEVVTQYYRAPELLAGCKHYDTAIDMWAIGCILAELLGRRILFKAIDKLSQLDMVTDLIGSPSDSDVAFVTSSDTVKSILKKPKPPALHKLYSLSPLASHGIVHLLSQMLIFNPVSDTFKYMYMYTTTDTMESCTSLIKVLPWRDTCTCKYDGLLIILMISFYFL